MAARLFLAIIALIGVMWYLSWYSKADKDKRNKSLITILLYGVAAALLILVVTGRIPWLFAMISAATPWINRFLTMKHLWNRFQGQPGQQQHTGSAPPNSKIGQAMTTEEALKVLGLEAGATEQEITDAHKKLMQKIHPDRGGSGYLASQINQAKDTLLSG